MLRLSALPKCGPISLACALSVAFVAQAETEAIRIEYRALSGCPSEAEFRAQVFERAASARLASDADRARTFVVSIARGREGVVGSLVVREPDGATVAREVAGADCAAVATALALATALAIDPRASAVPSTEAEKPPVDAAPPPVTAPTPASAAPKSSRNGFWSVALGPTVESGISPRLSLGGAAQLEWQSGAARSLVSALGVDLTWLETPTYGVSGATSSFRFLLARPMVCSLELPSTGALRVSPCLAAELGAVTATGASIPAPATETRFWAAADGLVRARLELTEAWFVELDAAVVLPLTRYQFLFREPDTQIYRVRAVAFATGLRLGVRILDGAKGPP